MNQEQLLQVAMRRFAECQSAEYDNREEAREDLKFIAGDQWNEQVKREREMAGRPALTFNRLPTFVQQVANDGRQNKPAIRISPVDSAGDPDTADVMQGLIRHIEYDSDADVAYQTALESAIGCGFGAFRIVTDYCDDRSFNQEIRIEAIPDPFSVYFDPGALRPDRADGEFCFLVTRMSRSEFKARWGESQTVATSFWDGSHLDAADWITEDYVQVAEYWYVERKKRKLLLLDTGDKVFADELTAEHENIPVIQERDVNQRVVKCAKLNGAEVLEEDEWPGEFIPIVLLVGKELWVEGKRRLFSLIRFARDPQRLYNYYKTAQAEAVMIAPKAPFIGVEGQFEGHEDRWATANQLNHPYLEYRSQSLNGQPAPPPQRNTYEPPVQALSVGAMQAADDIKATTGIFDASLGARSNETSGVAILQRKQEGDTATFHFVDNLARVQRHVGRILVNLIPKIYDTDRWIQILGEDQKQRVVQVNAQYRDEDGKDRHYQLSAAKYDVTVSTGPSYTTKRQEAFAMLTEFARSWPKLFEVAGDIVFRNSDIPGADELAERLVRTMPPEITADDDNPAQAEAMQLQAQLQELSAQNQQLQAALEEANDDIRVRREELDTRERIALLQAETRLAEIEAKGGNQQALELMRQMIASMQRSAQPAASGLQAPPPAELPLAGG